MTVADEHLRILPENADVADIVGADGPAPVCLVCEHASDAIPAALDDLGLAPGDRHAHAVFDIGAEALAREMAARLGAPLVLARWSRLIYDLNRPPEAPDAIPERVETIEIPGNRALTSAERQARADALYAPFHAVVSRTLDGFAAPPVLVTIHSFTPTWHGKPRATEIGFLHDADPALATAMLRSYAGPHRAELNEPYSAKDGVTHTLAKHGTARGLKNVMIEVRNDLLADAASAAAIAGELCAALEAALTEADQ